MLKTGDRSSRAQFPDNIVDPIVAGVFGVLANLVWLGVLWVFEKTGLTELRDWFTRRRKPPKR